MKIAITLNGPALDAGLDRFFGRCQAFAICDTDGGEIRIVDNTQNFQAAQGAGIQSAQNVIREGVEAVVTGAVGPKAFKVLSGSGVKAYQTPETGTLETVIEAYKGGTLQEITQANGVGPLS
jgi:predicted Fe-Mo cluster-binding NifX family protein